MREQTYPAADPRQTAPDANLTAASLNQVAAQPAHLSTRITRILALRGWTVDTSALQAGTSRAQRQCSGYVELREVGDWQGQRMHCATSHVSAQHNGATSHVAARVVADLDTLPDSMIPAGEMGDGDLSGTAVDRTYASPVPLPAMRAADIDASGDPDRVTYDAMRYAWLMRDLGACNLITADLMDADALARNVGVYGFDWYHVTIGAEPTQTAPRCVGVTATIYPTGPITGSTGESLISVHATTYAADTE